MSENYKKVDEVTHSFVLPNDVLQKVSAILSEEFVKGLSTADHHSATVKMFPTYVRDVPDGSEHGKFLALDLGGTNFRVLVVDIDGDQLNTDSNVYVVPPEIMRGTGKQLFDHITTCLAQFLEERGLAGSKLPLGFTFSFPCRQEGLSSARLVEWTKGFECSGVVDEDIVQLLCQAISRRQNLDVDVVALVNDTTGTLISCAHKYRQCRVGVIVGTGTNACYMERMENVETWKGDTNEPKQVIVNTEWGAFGENNSLEFIRTDFDREVDQNSLHPGKHLFEKMVSGMYLGEIVRLVVVHCVGNGYMLNGRLTEELRTQYAFKSEYISDVEADWQRNTNVVYRKMGVTFATEEDCECLSLICSRVSTRAAHLVSSAVSKILNKMKRPFTTVGVNGSMFKGHPHFKGLVEAKLKELTNTSYKFDMRLSEDGSGRGAALIAAVVVCKMQ